MKKYISELVGTFALTFFACGVAVLIGCDTPAGIIATALAFGLVIVAGAYSIGNISGCHINPAVSLAMYLSKKMTSTDSPYFYDGYRGSVCKLFFSLTSSKTAHLSSIQWNQSLKNAKSA